MPSKGRLAVLGERWVEIRILAARRYSVRLGSDSLAAARSHSGSDSRLRLSFIALVPLRYAAGASFTPEPVRIPFAKRKRALSA